MNAFLMGWINQGNPPQCGETVKNQQMISRLGQLGCQVRGFDFFRWKHHPMTPVKLLWNLFVHPSTPLILSTAPKNVKFMMQWHSWLRSKRPIIHWVIGGNLHKLVERGEIKPELLKGLYVNIVESQEMADGLKAMGVDNVITLPNFKQISYLPELKPLQGKTRFVFLSRIKPEKGVDYIFQAVKQLNEKGLDFDVDFYGKIDDDYQAKFLQEVGSHPNVRYCGFLNLLKQENYDVLAQYSAMLLPTYWKSEGFAGVFIDAFIAGLPVIATDWAHNATIITDGVTGLILPVHDPDAIAAAMRRVIENPATVQEMRKACREQAMTYDVKNVITPALLRKIGLL